MTPELDEVISRITELGDNIPAKATLALVCEPTLYNKLAFQVFEKFAGANRLLDTSGDLEFVKDKTPLSILRKKGKQFELHLQTIGTLHVLSSGDYVVNSMQEDPCVIILVETQPGGRYILSELDRLTLDRV